MTSKTQLPSQVTCASRLKKGMYSLRQAAILAYENLKTNLAKDEYKPITGIVGMWEHETHPTKFCICVEKFGIKYFSQEDADHLLSSLQNHYKVTTDWTGRYYCGLTIVWTYNKG